MDQAEQTVDAVSVEDRILSKFDVQPEEPSEEQEQAAPEAEAAADEESEPEHVEVEFNGVQYQVPPELKDALMRETDYTKKTTELASTRKTIELQQKEIALAQQKSQFDQSVAEHVDNLKMLEAYIKHIETSTNWSQLSTDEIVRARLELDQLKSQKQELAQNIQSQWNEFQARTNAEREKIRQEIGKALSSSIPSWSDETKGAIEKYVHSMGYPELAVQNMSASDYQVAWKAMQYDRLQAEKGEAVKKAAQQKGKVITPSSRKVMAKETKDYLAYRKKLSAAKTPQERSRAAEDRIGKIFGA